MADTLSEQQIPPTGQVRMPAGRATGAVSARAEGTIFTPLIRAAQFEVDAFVQEPGQLQWP